MLVRALVSIAGADFSLAPGDETDRFSPAEAMRLVNSRAAELVEIERETADSLGPVEFRKGRRKG